MRNFRLYIYNNNYKRLITSFDNDKPTITYNQPYSTFNEKLVEGENNQYTLTFSLSGFIYDKGVKQQNKWAAMLKMGTYLWLSLDNNTTEVQLVISKITPKIYKNNIIYEYEAQDEISYLWSKHWLGYSYSNLDTGIETIYTIAENIIKECGFGNWTIRDTEPVKLSLKALREKKITLEVLDSNPYQVLIEACNSLGCFLKVNYHLRYLTFFQREEAVFSGFRYRPDTALQTLSVNYDANNFINLLHVAGGTDEYDALIPLVPAIPLQVMNIIEPFLVKNDPLSINVWNINANESGEVFYYNNEKDDILFNGSSIFKDDSDKELNFNIVEEFLLIAEKVPHLGQFIFDNEYFIKCGLLSSNIKDEINQKINIEMRDNNIKLKNLTPLWYQYSWEIEETLNKVFNQVESGIFAEYQALKDKENITTEDLTKADNIIQGYIDDINNWLSENSTTTAGTNFWYKLNLMYGPAFDKYWTTTIDKDSLVNNFSIFKSFEDDQQYYLNQISVAKTEIQNYKNLLETSTSVTFDKESDVIPDKMQSKIDDDFSGVLLSYQGQLESWKSKLEMYQIKADSNYTIDGLTGKVGCVYDKFFDLLLNHLNNIANKNRLITKIGIDTRVTELQNYNHAIWVELYDKYGQFIYEGKYENTDELDSIALYNQAQIYFDNYNEPSASYSVSVLDLGALEKISIPRLNIGNSIRVYNELLNLRDWEYKPDGSIKERAVNNVNYTNNELIITQLTHDLRNPGKMAITVQKVQQYQDILSKLINSIRR